MAARAADAAPPAPASASPLVPQPLANSAWKDFVGGLLASVAKLAIGHPFDTLKVRLQSLNGAVGVGAVSAGTARGATLFPNAASASASASASAASVGVSPVRVSFGTVIRQTWRYEGVRGFYRGATPNFPGLAAYNSALFWGFGQCSNVVTALTHHRTPHQRDGAVSVAVSPEEMSLAEVALAGGGAGVLAAFVACPLELVRSRLQVQYGANPLAAVGAAVGGAAHAPAVYSGPIDLVRQTLAFHSGDTPVHGGAHGPPRAPPFRLRHVFGVAGLYRGLSVTLVREAISNVFYFTVFESVLRAFGRGTRQRSAKHSDATPAQLWVAGGLAGVANWLSIFPIDTVKSRLQTDDLYRPKYRSAMHCYRLTVSAPIVSAAAADAANAANASTWWSRHRVLWSGLTPCLLRAFFANGVAFIAVNATRRELYADASN